MCAPRDFFSPLFDFLTNGRGASDAGCWESKRDVQARNNDVSEDFAVPPVFLHLYYTRFGKGFCVLAAALGVGGGRKDSLCLHGDIG